MSSSLSEDQILNQIISRVYQFLAELRSDNNNLSSRSSLRLAASSASAGASATGQFEDSLADTLGDGGASGGAGADSSAAGSIVAAQDTLARSIVGTGAGGSAGGGGARDFVPVAPNARLSLPHHEASLQMFALGAAKLAKANGAEVQKQLAKVSAANLGALYKTVCLSAPSLWPVVLPDPAADSGLQPNLPFPFAFSDDSSADGSNAAALINRGLFLRSDDAFAQVVAPVVGAAATATVQDVSRALEAAGSASAQSARALLRCAAWDAAADVSNVAVAAGSAAAAPSDADIAAANAASEAAVVQTLQALEALLLKGGGAIDGTALLVAAVRAETALRRYVSTPDGRTTTIRGTDTLRRAIATFLNNTKDADFAALAAKCTLPAAQDAGAAPVALNWILHVRAHQPTPVEDDSKKPDASSSSTSTATPAATTTGAAAAASADSSEAASSPSRDQDKKKKKLKKKAPPEKPWRLPLRILPGYKVQLSIEEGLPHTSANSSAFVVGPAVSGAAAGAAGSNKVVQVPKTGVKETLVLEHADGGSSYLFGKGDAVRIKISVTPPAAGSVAGQLSAAQDVVTAVAGFVLTATEVLSLSNPTACVVAASGNDKKSKAAVAAAAVTESTDDTAAAAAAAAAAASAASAAGGAADDDAAKKDDDAAAASTAALTGGKKGGIPVLRADPVFTLGLAATPLEAVAQSAAYATVTDAANAAKLNMFFMRAQCMQSWRPLATQLLAVVVHCGAGFNDGTLQHVAQRWLPDWNQPLQGEVNQGGRDRLAALMTFILTRVQAQPAGSQAAAAILQHLRTVFIDQEALTVELIERELAARSGFAAAAGVALKQLRGLVAAAAAAAGSATSNKGANVARATALNLVRWLGRGGRHYFVGPFGGATAAAAAAVRSGLALLLSELQQHAAGDVKPALLALAGTPNFTSDDVAAVSADAAPLVKSLVSAANPAATAATATSGAAIDLGATCRLAQLCPAAQPEMNTNSLGVTIGSSSTGISINRTSMGGLCLRSSCAWPVGGDSSALFPDGVRYCEFTFQQTRGNVLRAMVGVCDANTKFEDFEGAKSELEGGLVGQTALDSKVDDCKNKMSVPFGYEGDVVGVGVDLRAETAFYTLNGKLMFAQHIKLATDHTYIDDTVGGEANKKYLENKNAPAKSVRKDFHPFLLYEARDRTTVNANFGHSPFAFDVVQYRASALFGAAATPNKHLLDGFEGDHAARCLLYASNAAASTGAQPWVIHMATTAGKALGQLLNVATCGVDSLRAAMIAAQLIQRMGQVVTSNNGSSSLHSTELKAAQAAALQSLRLVCKNAQVGDTIRAVAWRAVEVLLRQCPGVVEVSTIQKPLLDALRGAQDQQKEEDEKKQKQAAAAAAPADSTSPSKRTSTASTAAGAAAAASKAAAVVQPENAYLPAWNETDETVAVLNGPRVTVAPRPIDDVDEEDLEQHHAGIPAMAVGSVLPEGADVVSFRVYFHRPPLTGHGNVARMASGGCFIGVTSQSLASLSAQHDWKTASPPCVWAMHDEAAFQLPHADIATVMTDNITFMAGSTLTVTVRRTAGTVSFSRGGAHDVTLFRHVDPSVPLRPFVLLIGKDSYAQLLPGSMTAIVSPTHVLQGALNRTLFQLLAVTRRNSGGDAAARDAFTAIVEGVTQMVGSDLESERWVDQQRALSLLGVLPRKSSARLVVPSGHEQSASVRGEILAVLDNLAVVNVEDPAASNNKKYTAALDITGLVEQRQLHAVRSVALSASSSLAATSEDPSADGDAAAGDLVSVICRPIAGKLAKIVTNWCTTLQVSSAVRDLELAARDAIVLEEANAREAVASTVRGRRVDAVVAKSISAAMPLLQPPVRPATFTFHPHRCSTHVDVPDHYRGALMLAPSSASTRGPHVGVAREAVDMYGVSSFRIKVMAEWSSLIPPFLPWARFQPGCYVGLCLESYNGTPRFLPQEDPPSVWALSFIDSTKLHLKHGCAFPTNLPLVRNGDTLRFVVDREKGTLEAFRTPEVGARERQQEQKIGVIYDNLPKGVMLFPFVQLMSPRNAAMFLPLNDTLPRAVTTCVRAAPLIGNAARSVSGSSDLRCIVCLARFVDNTLTPPHWFHCTQCADIDLCQVCFNAHYHCGHEFAQMRATGFLANEIGITAEDLDGSDDDTNKDAATKAAAPAAAAAASSKDAKGKKDAGKVVEKKRAYVPEVNSEVEISPVAAQLRASDKCVPVEGSFETSVRSLRGQDSMSAVWSLLRRPQAQATFECSLDFSQHESQAGFRGSGASRAASLLNLPPGCVLYAGLILTSVADKLAAAEIPAYLAKTALDPKQRDGIVLASDSSRFIWPEYATGQASSAGVDGAVLDFSVYLSFFLGQDGLVEVQTNGSALFQVKRDLWVGERFSIVVCASGFSSGAGGAAPVTVSLYSGMDSVPLVARVMERVKDVGGLRASIGGKARIVMAGSTAREALVAVKHRGQLKVGDRAVHVDSCIDKATPVMITRLSTTDEAATVHDGFKEFRTDMRCLLIPASRANQPIDENYDVFPFPEERDRLARFYKHYVPDKKIEDVEKAIMAYSQSKGGFAEMWKVLQAKYGPEIEQKKRLMPQPATRDLLVKAGDLLRVVATLRLFSSGGAKLARMLPVAERAALNNSVIGALSVLDRELDITALGAALASAAAASAASGSSGSGARDAVHLLSLAVTHAPTMPVATDRTLRNAKAKSAAAAAAAQKQADGSSDWWAQDPKTLPLAIDSNASLTALLDSAGAVAAAGNNSGAWGGSMLVSTGLFSVLNVDFAAATAKLTVAVGQAGTLEIRDVVRSRSIRSIQFLLAVPADADEITRSVAKRLEQFTMRYEPGARRLLCPQTDSRGDKVLMVCVLSVGDDAQLVGHAVLRGGAEASIELRAVAAATASSSSSTSVATGGALPPLDATSGIVDIDDAADSARLLDAEAEQHYSKTLGTGGADGQVVSRLALTSTIAELALFVRAAATRDGAMLDAKQLYSILVPTKASTDAQNVLAQSGIAADGDRLADLLGVASQDVFALIMPRTMENSNADSASSSSSSSLTTTSARVSRAVAAARVVRFAATAGCLAGALTDPKKGTFWNGLLTALRALHVCVISSSATRECVATVRVFAFAAFTANKALSQFLFGPIVHWARTQYEQGSALGRITGAVRSVIDLIAGLTSRANQERAVSELVHDGLARLSSIALPVEQLAFLADAAASAAGRPAPAAWPAVAALQGGSDTVDAATVRRNGDGVAWNMVEPRKTATDKEAGAANRPGAKEQQSRIEGSTLFCGTAISTAAPFDFHYGDRVPSKPKPRYYEAVIPPESVRVAVGWTTKTAAELAKLRRTQMVREIHSPDTVVFDGQAIFHNGSYVRYGWAGTGSGDVCGASVKTSDDGKKVILRWSINGEVFPEYELPEKMRNKPLRAFVQISRSDKGMRLGASAELCRFIPLGFEALASSEQAATDYTSEKRRAADSAASVVDLEKAAKELAEFLAESDKEAAAQVASPVGSPAKTGAAAAATADSAAVVPAAARKTIKHANDILVIQRCLTHCFDAMDIEGNLGGAAAAAAAASGNNNNNNNNGGGAASTISVLKRIVTPTYRRTVLAVLQPLANRESDRQHLPGCAVRWYQLFSHQPRTEADALHHSVLAQLKRQIAPSQFQHTPMFSTSLQMTDNGHTPIDVGGPYFQTWALLGEELSVENETPRTTVPGFEGGAGAAATTTTTGSSAAAAGGASSSSSASSSTSLRFYRNPLFRTVSCNARGKVLVPQAHRNTPTDLEHFRFLGQLWGHLARAKSPLPIDVSSVVWKHIVTDPVTFDDWCEHVESSWRGFVEDEDLLASGADRNDPAAEELLEYFPAFFDELAKVKAASTTGAGGADEKQQRRRAAENCVLNSIRPQLDALRAGVWELLGRRAVCAMTAADLELAVCGDPNPSMEQLLASVTCQLDTHEAAVFWAALKQLTPAEWSDFFFFCAGQRRFPLNKKISVVPMSGATEKHMPMASTCFNLLKMPPYKSDVQCLEKLREAIKVNVMELA